MGARMNLLNRIHLPAWAQLDHPLVQRELAELPAFLGADGNLTVKMVLLAIAGLGLAGAACGGLWWPPIAAALGLLPLLYGAMLVNRDRAAQRWDMLRVTPYSIRELLLAKVSAVLYRLAPLLALLLAGQSLAYVLSSLMVLSMWGTVAVNGVQVFSASPGMGAATLPGIGIFFGLTLADTVVGFVLNIVVGLLASTLTDGRGAAYAAAIGLRLLVAGLLTSITLLVAGIGMTGGMAGVSLLEGGSLTSLPAANVAWSAAFAVLGVLINAAVTAGVFLLAERRAAAS